MKWRTLTDRSGWQWTWHSYFAWFPVEIGKHWVWLERVERKVQFGDDHGWVYEYRVRQ